MDFITRGEFCPTSFGGLIKSSNGFIINSSGLY